MTAIDWFPQDVCDRTALVVRERRDSLAVDLEVLLAATLPDGPPAEVRKRLASRLIELFATAVVQTNLTDHAMLTQIARVQAAGVSLANLFTAVRLGERCVLDEVALDPHIGATSQHWPAVAEQLRKAAFDMLACYCQVRAFAAGMDATDRPTTLLSRWVFEIALDKELQRVIRYHHPIAVILFDVDDLAGISETHGYGVRGLILERLAVFMRQYFRQHDWVARYGTATIAVLLGQISCHDAVTLAEGARQSIRERLVFSDKDDRPVSVTVSASVVTVTLGRGTSDSPPLAVNYVMKEAEAALRRAKAHGGNSVERVEVARASLSISEAASHLHCATRTIRKLIDTGVLPAVDHKGRVRVDRLAVEAYGKRHPRPPAI